MMMIPPGESENLSHAELQSKPWSTMVLEREKQDGSDSEKGSWTFGSTGLSARTLTPPKTTKSQNHRIC